MIVISDASVLMNLAAIEQLNLLPDIFGKITVAQAVFDEVVIKGAGKSGSEEVKNANWIITRNCQNRELLTELETHLDAGEAEAIALSKELNADLLIIDEKRGRAVAKQYQIEITGLLGVLLIAKSKGYILEVKKLMLTLKEEIDFYIDDKTFQQVLKMAGEN